METKVERKLDCVIEQDHADKLYRLPGPLESVGTT
jgi:hypothetical protein